jgi:hypothetical protein
MLKRHPFLIFLVTLLVASFACSQAAPVAAPMDSNALNTSIAQTVAARQTEVALNAPTSTAIFTLTPVPPTATLEPTLSVTPDLNLSPTLETPMITVSVDTNCRTGPGSIYQRVGMLLVGETAEVVGRGQNVDGEFWYIRNPDEGLEYCWVWGGYATVTGNTLPLLFMSPQPPPASSFTATYQKLEKCTVWWLNFKLTNTSAGLFKSVSLILRDADTNTVANLQANNFPHSIDCKTPEITDSLISGGTVVVSSPPLGYNPTGHNLNAKIKICTDADQKGICLTQELNFKP